MLGTSSKELIELLLEYNYTLYRIETDYPCDHICVPNVGIEQFEMQILPKITYSTSKISGKKVELKFENEWSQNYSEILVLK